MARKSRTSEADLTNDVLRSLTNAGGSLTTSALKADIKKTVSLTPGDLAQSKTRNDKLIDQIVGNIVCHRKEDGNIIKENLIAYDKPANKKCGTLSITPAGTRHLSSGGRKT